MMLPSQNVNVDWSKSLYPLLLFNFANIKKKKMFSLLIVRVCVCHLTYSDETELAMCLINCHHVFCPLLYL